MVGKTISHYQILEKLGEGGSTCRIFSFLDINHQAGNMSSVRLTVKIPGLVEREIDRE